MLNLRKEKSFNYTRKRLASNITTIALKIKQALEDILLLHKENGSSLIDVANILDIVISGGDNEFDNAISLYQNNIELQKRLMILRSIYNWKSSEGSSMILYVSLFLIQSLAMQLRQIIQLGYKCEHKIIQLIDHSFDDLVLQLLEPIAL